MQDRPAPSAFSHRHAGFHSPEGQRPFISVRLKSAPANVQAARWSLAGRASGAFPQLNRVLQSASAAVLVPGPSASANGALPLRSRGPPPPVTAHPTKPAAGERVTARRSVVVAAPNPLTRFAIRRALEDGAFDICAEAEDAEDAVDAVLRERPDVCLLDLDIPGDAIAALSTIKSGAPSTAVVIVATPRDHPNLLTALCAGASGHIPEDIAPERLALALELALDGEIPLPRELLLTLIDQRSERGTRAHSALETEIGARLTNREWEVFELLREGLPTAEIARRLFVSRVTVRTHICSILKKLRVPDRESAIRLLKER